jgi:hypothetical protein
MRRIIGTETTHEFLAHEESILVSPSYLPFGSILVFTMPTEAVMYYAYATILLLRYTLYMPAHPCMRAQLGCQPHFLIHNTTQRSHGYCNVRVIV